MADELKGADYVNDERREYSLYVLSSRALPHASDGLKHSTRRLLWTARNGHKVKSATLVGATMPLHPHGDQALEGALNTVTAPYGNNIPMFANDCAFGTLLKPKAFGAARYTAVSTSQFAKDVMFRDIEILPMMENYDATQMEPVHFLPLMPMSYVNPQEGIAIGYACSILARDPAAIVKHQIAYLEDKEVTIKEPRPCLLPINQKSTGQEQDRFGTWRWVFKGEFDRIDSSNLLVTNLPYGLSHEKLEAKLLKLIDEEKIQDFTDDSSKGRYKIKIRFKRGELNDMNDDDVLARLGLIQYATENANVINFDGESVWETSYADMIRKFTDWRLGWYVKRYERLSGLIQEDIQKYKDILCAIKNDLGSVARTTKTRSDLKDFCKSIGIVYIDYIVDLPVYRFTEEEKKKAQDKLDEANKQLKEYQALLKSEQKRKDVYVSELKEVLNNLNKGVYYSG